jgi:hypothetical protein
VFCRLLAVFGGLVFNYAFRLSGVAEDQWLRLAFAESLE